MSSKSQYDSIIAPERQQSCVGSENPGPGLARVAVDNIDAAPTTHDRLISDLRSATVSVAVRRFPKACVWSMGIPAYSAITDTLRFVLDRRYSIYYNTKVFPSTDSVSRRLFNDGNLDFNYIDGLMRNLSDVMTATMRSHGGEAYDSAGEYATGPAIQTLTCIRARWAWISYPAALVGLTTLWLAVMMWQSPRSEMRTREWKSSSLPILLAGMSDEKINAAKSNSGKLEPLFDTSLTRMEQLLASVHAQLVRDENGQAKFA
ncbi:hypothetical protein F5Y14DRAFT_454987 [Nemania sp. NC0429]|nr:hypothetical protein F5Y14DRAFT_454987 [Nemania sp. NC0429]